MISRSAPLPVTVPPLRQRTEDIPLLVSHFLRQTADRNGIPVPEILEKSFAKMLKHTWPGNVRELKNAVERMVVTTHNGKAGSFLPDETFEFTPLLSLPATPGRLRDEMEKTERVVIEAALREHKGEINATFQALGISRRALYERMKKYGLNKEDFRP